MATRVELPREIVKIALEQACTLRLRQMKAATNDLIKKALDDEERAIRTAISTITDTK